MIQRAANQMRPFSLCGGAKKVLAQAIAAVRAQQVP
jgi:hypothetical protein